MLGHWVHTLLSCTDTTWAYSELGRALRTQTCGLDFSEHVKGTVLQSQPGFALATLDLGGLPGGSGS